MSNMILVIGRSGSGKSTSLRHLNPQETFIFNGALKPPPFAGSKRNYIRRSAEHPDGNLLLTRDYKKVMDLLGALQSPDEEVRKKYAHIKNIVVDDFQYFMVGSMIDKRARTDWNKWDDIASEVWHMLEAAGRIHADINFIVLSHSKTDKNGFTNIKTVGKMLDERIVIEGLFDVVIHAIKEEKNNECVYKLILRGPRCTAKMPFDMPREFYLPDVIDSDLSVVLEKLVLYNNYNNEDIK